MVCSGGETGRQEEGDKAKKTKGYKIQRRKRKERHK
jgi:hypothetical protein